MRLAKIAPDWVVKGLHLHVGRAEVMVRPGRGGSIVLKPVFSSTTKQERDAAIQQVRSALASPQFRSRLHRVALRGVQYLKHSGLSGAAAKSGELRFLAIALKKLGLA